MTEKEWWECDDPEKMLEFLRGKTSDRKLRLYLCESYRKIPSERLPGNIQKAISVMERYAEGLASPQELLDARSRAWQSVTNFAEQNCRSRSGPIPEDQLHHARLASIARGTDPNIDNIYFLARPQLLPVTENLNQVQLLHDIFGNPFRTVTLAPVLHSPTVVTLSHAAYENRTMPAGTLEPNRLAILADALEDAGCTDAGILDHLRGPGPHVRGCWVLDLLLNKS